MRRFVERLSIGKRSQPWQHPVVLAQCAGDLRIPQKHAD